MAEKIAPLTAKRFGAANVKYPWDTWLDGAARRLKRGVDFAVSPYQLRSTAYSKASERGLHIRTRIVGDALELEAYKS